MTVINLQPFFIEKWEQYLLSLRLMVVTEDERRLYKVFLQVPEEVQIIFTQHKFYEAIREKEQKHSKDKIAGLLNRETANKQKKENGK